ncbi:hypothetical protein EDD36DRAFT_414265 [Exophiala viscosa]|uniref:Zn(2)-C6 fungal-type domain-containing protein n=1 Tax=Exophiala viscosa TaxID=2486360 RepID=A0AAN6E7G8_9EURO|nr:hypothetical protein EDD36DRAFT_414265 [Exophiala viscosa]
MAEATDLDTLLQLLPACRRCRSHKRRCDTQLPVCANCSKVGADCVFFDHVSKELLPRTYIASLVDHLRSLEAARESSTGQISDSASNETLEAEGQHFFGVGDALRYLGPRAPLVAQVDAVLPKAQPRIKEPCLPLEIPSSSFASEDTHRFLVGKYFDTLQELYPILDPTLPYLEDPSFSRADLDPSECFNLYMVYSIACHCLPGNDCQLVLLSDTFYKEALTYADQVTAELTVEALQAVVLLALRSLYDAQNGSLGQQVAFAHRMEVELSTREVDEHSLLLERLRLAIFCVGTQVGTALDRPSGLIDPELTGPMGSMRDAEKLSVLHKLQSRFRNGQSLDESDMIILDEAHATQRSPLLAAAWSETRLIVNPNAESASQLLTCYDREDMILTVFTSHWVYKAATILLSGGLTRKALDGHVLAVTILGRCALKWPNARAIQEMLNLLFKSKTSPDAMG